MSRNKTNFVRVSILLLIVAMIFTGCAKAGTEQPAASGNNEASGNNGAADSSAAPSGELPHVNLTWYYGITQQQPDQQAIEDEINNYLAEKTQLNVTLKLKPIDFGSYDQKMNVAIAAGEDMDIIWTTGGWLLKYNENVNKGAFLALDDLLPEYAPKTFNDMMPAKYWDDVKADADGKIYAVPNYQIAATAWGFIFQKRFVDKYKFDITKVKSFKDLEPFLDTLQKNEPDIIPFAGGSNPGKIMDNLNVKNAGDIYYYANDPYTSIDIYQSPEYKAQLDLMHSWYEKKYIYQDSATVKDWNEVSQKGNIAVTIDSTFKPGGDAEFPATNGGYEVVSQRISNPAFSGVTSTMNAISKASKNPERALMLLELVNNDKELYQLISYGIEGKHYELKDGVYTAVPDSGYAPGVDWVFGNQFNGLVKEGQPADVFEQTKKLNESGEVSPLTGFHFNDSELSTEVAAVNAVKGEYAVPLETGTVDPNVALPEFQEALKKAGYDKIQAELGKQLTDWAVKNGKK